MSAYGTYDPPLTYAVSFAGGAASFAALAADIRTAWLTGVDPLDPLDVQEALVVRHTADDAVWHVDGPTLVNDSLRCQYVGGLSAPQLAAVFAPVNRRSS